VVTENESKKPKEDEPKIAAVQTQASTESVAAEATATPSSDAIPESARSVAPAQGTGETARRVRATWQKALVAHLDKHKRYPAERALKSAEIHVRFTLDRLGHVLSTTIEKGSGDAAFDDAAVAMVKRSDPVPPPPPLIADEGLSFTLPVIFRVKGKELRHAVVTHRHAGDPASCVGWAKRSCPHKTRKRERWAAAAIAPLPTLLQSEASALLHQRSTRSSRAGCQASSAGSWRPACIVPRIFRLGGLLHLEQIGRMILRPSGADRAFAEQGVVGRHFLHLGDHGAAVMRIAASASSALK
jgi:TonB family protein